MELAVDGWRQKDGRRTRPTRRRKTTRRRPHARRGTPRARAQGKEADPPEAQLQNEREMGDDIGAEGTEQQDENGSHGRERPYLLRRLFGDHRDEERQESDREELEEKPRGRSQGGPRIDLDAAEPEDPPFLSTRIGEVKDHPPVAVRASDHLSSSTRNDNRVVEKERLFPPSENGERRGLPGAARSPGPRSGKPCGRGGLRGKDRNRKSRGKKRSSSMPFARTDAEGRSRSRPNVTRTRTRAAHPSGRERRGGVKGSLNPPRARPPRRSGRRPPRSTPGTSGRGPPPLQPDASCEPPASRPLRGSPRCEVGQQIKRRGREVQSINTVVAPIDGDKGVLGTQARVGVAVAERTRDRCSPGSGTTTDERRGSASGERRAIRPRERQRSLRS